MNAHALASLSIIAFGRVCGGFLAELLGRLQGASHERISRLSSEGSFYGFAGGLLCWLVLIALDVL